MKKKNLLEDSFRNIKGSFTRFLAIVAMIALGTLVFVGMKLSSPNMAYTIDEMKNIQNAYDVKVESYIPLTKDDVDILKNYKYTDKIDSIKTTDVFLKDDSDKIVRLSSLNSNVSKLIVTQGKIKDYGNYIALDNRLKDKGIKIGDSIEFEDNDKLKSYKYEVSAFVKTIDYLHSTEKNGATIGDGKIDYFAMIPNDMFKKQEEFDKIYLTLKDLKDYNVSDPQYEKIVTKRKEEIKDLLKDRPNLRVSEIKKDANEEIASYEDEINDGYKKLSDGKKELEDAKNTLDNSKIEYEENLRNFNNEIANAKDTLSDNEDMLYQSKLKLEDAYNKIQSGKAKIEDSKNTINSNKEKLDKAKEKIDNGKEIYDTNLKKLNEELKNLENQKSILVANEDKINDSLEIANSALDEINTNIDKLEYKNSEIDKKIQQAKDTIDRLSTIDKDLEDIDNNLDMLNTSKDEIDTKLKPYYENLDKIKENENLIKENDSKIESLQQENLSLDNTINDIYKENEALNEKIENSEDDISTLEEEFSKNLDKLNEKVKEKTDNEKEIENLNSTNDNLEKENKDLSDSLHEFDPLLNKKDELDKKIEELNKKKKELIYIKENYNKKELEDLILKLNKEKEATLILIEYLNNKKSSLIDTIKKLEYNKNLIDENIEKIDNGISLLNEGLEELKLSNDKLKDSYKDYENGLKKINLAIETLNSYEKALNESSDKYNEGLREYNIGRDKLDNAYIELSNKEKEGKDKLADAKKKLDEGESEYLKNKKEFDKNYDDNLKKLDDSKNELEDRKKELDNIKPVAYDVTSIMDDQFVDLYSQSSRNMKKLSNIFPTIFYMVALLVSLTTMTRMVDKDRIQIGTYKAIGYNNKDIAFKYVMYGAIASIIALIIGTIIGYKLIMPAIFNAYYTNTIFDKKPPMVFLTKYMLIALILNFVCTTFATYIAVNNSLKENSAKLMRPKSPKKGNKTFLENIKPLWNRLGFFGKVTARNIFRYKGRLFMTLLGVAGCTALITMGFGLKDSVEAMSRKQFNDIVKYNVISIYNPDSNKDSLDKYNNYINENSSIEKSMNVYMDNMTFYDENNKEQMITMIVPEDEKKFMDFVNLKNRVDDEKYNLKNEDVVVTEITSNITGKDIGNKLEVTKINGDKGNLNIKAISENYFGHYIYLNKDVYEKNFGPIEYNTRLIIADRSKLDKIGEDLNKFDASISTISMSNQENRLDELVKSLNIIVFIIVLISSMLCFVVLYNLTNINVEERKRELSTIKVLGFFPKEITIYIYRETLILSLIGIIIGLLFGKSLHSLVIWIVAPSMVMLDPALPIKNYIIAAAITIIFSIITMLIINRKLKHIDMVESLKATE